MLPKNWRVKIADFNKNPKSPIKKFSNNFSLFIKNGNLEGWKFVVNVPFGLDKRAYRRNYSKRIIEQVILQEHNNLKGNGAVLIKVRKIINREDRKQMEAELRRILNNELC